MSIQIPGKLWMEYEVIITGSTCGGKKEKEKGY
jgi:hypothetical protein